jgi:transposase
MAIRSSACHVAEIRHTVGGKTYAYHLLRRTFRKDGKVQHQTLGNLSHLPRPVIELIRRAVRGEPLVAPGEAFEILRSRPHGHVAAVLGTVRRLEVDRLLASRPCRERQLVLAMLVARLLDPGSKLALARGLDREALSSTLGEVLEVESADADELYKAMDWLLSRQSRIETGLAKRHFTDGTLVLYDVTSTYFEGRTCPLAKLGHSRDGKKGSLQIVVGLLCQAEGCPVAVEVFDGNTGDPSTLSSQIEKVRKRFGLTRVVFVGDRGLITAARIRAELRPVAGLDWITALRAPQIRQLVDSGALQLSLFDQRDLAEIRSAAYPGERLIVCKNPLLAQERARKREELLQATERKLAEIAVATRRPRGRLQGQDKIGLRVGQALNSYKVGKHFRLDISDEGFRYERDTESVRQEAALDGFYVIRTSVPAEVLRTEDTVRAYKNLSVVERAFRSLKRVDLHLRPIYHRLADRVKAHVLLCMLAYYVEWHMRRALAPMLFDDDDKAAAAALRTSIVAPAQRSPRALGKAQTRCTADGAPVHSFPTLLRDLATIARNRVQPKQAPAEASFDILTTPTQLQQRALDLLRVSINM